MSEEKKPNIWIAFNCTKFVHFCFSLTGKHCTSFAVRLKGKMLNLFDVHGFFARCWIANRLCQYFAIIIVEMLAHPLQIT